MEAKAVIAANTFPRIESFKNNWIWKMTISMTAGKLIIL